MGKEQEKDIKFIHKDFNTIMTKPETLSDEELWKSIKEIYESITLENISGIDIDRGLITDSRNLKEIVDRVSKYVGKDEHNIKTLSGVIMFFAGFWYNMWDDQLWIHSVRMWY